MMKLLALTALFTFVFALSAEIGKRQMETLPPGACIWNNTPFAHSEKFFVRGTINCTFWVCLHGRVEHEKTICGDNNSHCHEHGDVWSEGNCSIYECQRVNDTVSQRVFRYTGCLHNGTCVTDNCWKYRCARENNQTRMLISLECQDHTGVCRHLGERFPGRNYGSICKCSGESLEVPVGTFVAHMLALICSPGK